MKGDQASANNPWPSRIWLAGETREKRRSSAKEPGSVAYVRADEYDELLAWVESNMPESHQGRGGGDA